MNMPRKKHYRNRPKADYSVSQLESYAKDKLWNATHLAKVQNLEEDCAIMAIEAEGRSILAKMPKIELPSNIQINDTLKVYLSDPKQKDASEMPRASASKEHELEALEKLEKAIAEKEALQGFLNCKIKGGYSVSLFVNNREEADAGLGLRGFLPSRFAVLNPNERPDLPISTMVSLHIKEWDTNSGTAIVSRRAFLKEERQEKAKAFWETVHVGQEVEGYVKSTMPYGVFVDLGGADALLHISDVSWDKHPTLKELPVGAFVHAKILELDQEHQKLKIGIKQLTTNPWDSVEGHYAPGSLVEGVVVAISDFGVFVRLADGVEGLIHLSEMAWQRVKHPSALFRIGDQVKAKVLTADGEHHRISLSTRALMQNPVEALAEQFPVGAVLKTKVVRLSDFGAFVALSDQINGFVHVSEISWSKRIADPAEVLKEGEEVEIVVMGFEPDRQRVSCSIKRTQEDPWPKWRQKYKRGSHHTAKIVGLNTHGAECELEPGLVAFCPSRELFAEGELYKRPQDAFKIGQELLVEITQMDIKELRVTVSVKARQQTEMQKDYQQYIEKQGPQTKTTLGELVERSRKEHE